MENYSGYRYELMFYKCYFLITLPDISKWDTSNVKDLNSMFCGCVSLKSLPDLSNWNTSNVTDMRQLFVNCISLKSPSTVYHTF